MSDTKLTVNSSEFPIDHFEDLPPHSMSFYPPNSTEIMRLDKDGMIFMGKRITDAGEAYEAWMKVMAMMQGIEE